MEQHGLRVFENRVLVNICGPKTVEVTGDCRRLPNDELYDLFLSSNIIRVIKCDTVWERRGVYRVLVGKLEKTDR
jgi:hypothetical protein